MLTGMWQRLGQDSAPHTLSAGFSSLAKQGAMSPTVRVASHATEDDRGHLWVSDPLYSCPVLSSIRQP